jgi:hypothetical protein
LVDSVQAARLELRTLAGRIRALDAEIAQLDGHLDRLVRAVAPRTVGLLGIGPGHPGQLVRYGWPEHHPASMRIGLRSPPRRRPHPGLVGKTICHRLNPGGDRDGNAASGVIAVVRMRYCERTKAYASRRVADGLCKREIVRCPKRYIAHGVFKALRADLADFAA